MGIRKKQQTLKMELKQHAKNTITAKYITHIKLKTQHSNSKVKLKN